VNILRLPADRGFRSLWTAVTISVFGDQITAVAIPTLAIVVLGVGPLETGLLAAAGWLAWPILGPIVGVWVDRLVRRRILIAADLVRMAVLLSIPVAAVAGVLGFPQLLVVAAIVGLGNVFFELAFSAHTPEVVAGERIPVANARLEASRATSYMAGPALAGLLISLVTAAGAVVVDAATFLASAILIRRAPPAVRPTPARAGDVADAGPRRSLRTELVDGFRVMRNEPVLLRMTLAAAMSNFGLVAARAVLLLHLYRDLGLSPAVVGLVLGAPGIASIAGVTAAGAVTRRLGVGQALLAATVLESAMFLFIPFAGGPAAPFIVAAALGASSFWGLVWNVVAVSVRQVAVAPEVQGRVAAIRGAIGYGVIPIGSLAGGVLGAWLTSAGVPAALPLTIGVGAVAGVASGLPMLGRSMAPVRRWQFGQPWPASGSAEGQAAAEAR